MEWLHSQLDKYSFVGLIFFRGAWCPYCPKHLRTMDRPALADVHALQGAIFAVSATGPDTTLEIEKRWKLEYDGVISDVNLELAKHFGVTLTDDPAYPSGQRCEPGVAFIRKDPNDPKSMEILYFWTSDGPLYRPILKDLWEKTIAPRIRGEIPSSDGEDGNSEVPTSKTSISAVDFSVIGTTLKYKLGWMRQK